MFVLRSCSGTPPAGAGACGRRGAGRCHDAEQTQSARRSLSRCSRRLGLGTRPRRARATWRLRTTLRTPRARHLQRPRMPPPAARAWAAQPPRNRSIRTAAAKVLCACGRGARVGGCAPASPTAAARGAAEMRRGARRCWDLTPRAFQRAPCVSVCRVRRAPLEAQVLPNAVRLQHSRHAHSCPAAAHHTPAALSGHHPAPAGAQPWRAARVGWRRWPR